MAVEQYNGRLVTADGKLYAHGDGTDDPFDSDGSVTLREVTYDPDTKGYIYVEKSAPSHNERFEKNIVQFQGTSQPLYDADGNFVSGDLHHFAPLEDDPHLNGITFHDDAVAPTMTGHTDAEAYNHE